MRPLGPPPPAITAALAEARVCRGCAAPCVGACEANLVRLHPTGHRLAGAPYLAFDEAGCTFCGDCVQACPLELGRDAPAERLGTASLDRSSCIAWNGVVCSTCRTACRYEAVAIRAGQRPRIDARACNGCGACVSVCPSASIAIEC